jgi:hypothetical protein
MFPRDKRSSLIVCSDEEKTFYNTNTVKVAHHQDDRALDPGELPHQGVEREAVLARRELEHPVVAVSPGRQLPVK